MFTRTETVEIVLDSWRFLQREAEFEIYGYVILENHLHLIASSPDLSRDMQRFKSYTAKRIINYLEQTQAKRVLELLALFNLKTAVEHIPANKNQHKLDKKN
ncbi:MAG: hypothetical protein PHD43_22445 [Methylococcales bacterium]|nr:hypothetical protein [Methylococcales bacterium]